MDTHRIFLSLGSNTEDKAQKIKQALKLLSTEIKINKYAPIYATKPWGYKNQQTFLNTAIEGTTNLNPMELLRFAKIIETGLGRQKRFRNGPREIDIDIILYDDLVVERLELQIPHPRLNERDFVLKPILDIDKSIIHPKLKIPLRDLYNKIDQDNRYIINEYNE